MGLGRSVSVNVEHTCLELTATSKTNPSHKPTAPTWRRFETILSSHPKRKEDELTELLHRKGAHGRGGTKCYYYTSGCYSLLLSQGANVQVGDQAKSIFHGAAFRGSLECCVKPSASLGPSRMPAIHTDGRHFTMLSLTVICIAVMPCWIWGPT